MQTRAFEWLARIGYIARGTVFVVLGTLVMLAALGSLRRSPDPKDVLQTLLSNAVGEFIVSAISVGLLSFAVWRIVQALFDADNSGSDAKGVMRRALYFIQGLFYVALAAVPATMLWGWIGRASSDQTVHDWTGWVLQWRFGQWLIGISGLIIILSGVGMGVSGLLAHFKRRLAVRGKRRSFITALGRFGFLARAIVYAAAGAFLLVSALYSDPGEARGVAGTLRAFGRQPLGSVWLGIMAAGLFAFGCYSIAEGAWRRIEAPTVRQAAAKAGLKKRQNG
jgi:hypothetical protein